MCDQCSNSKVFVEIVGDSADQQICAGDNRRRQGEIVDNFIRHFGCAGLNIEKVDVPFPSPAVQLDAAIDRNLRAIKEADLSAEEGNELSAKSDSKRILICAFQEEFAFLGEEQRKPCEVDLPGIDFGF